MIRSAFAGLVLAWSLLFAAMPAAAQEDIPTIEVGIGGYNTFKFNTPFEQVVFPPKSPLRGDPVPMSGNSAVLVELLPNATVPVQMVVSLQNGDVVTLLLKPVQGKNPIVWSQPTFGDTPNFRTPIQRPEDKWLQETFLSMVSGKMPEGFTAVPPPSSGSMGELRADYIAAFRNEAYVLLVARLISRELKWIAPQDLYVPGVKAVLIDGDRVGVNDAPIAYILIAGSR